MKKAFLTSIFLFFLVFLLFSQQSYSKDLENKLLQDKYTLEIELLKGSLSYDFPYNIIVQSKNQQKINENTEKISIIFSQDYAFHNYTALIPLFNAIETSPYNIEILLSANDGQIHSSIAPSLQGIQSYIENKVDSTSFYTIILDTNIDMSKKALNLEIGTKNFLTPLSLSKSFIEILNKNNIPYSIKGSFSPFVRLGLTNENYLLFYLLEKEIPSIAINSDRENIGLAVELVCEHIEKYNPHILDGKSSQYDFFNFFGKFISIEEFHLVSFILISAFLTLLAIVFFPFLLGRNRFLHKQELSKSWPLLPFLIFLNALFFFFSQKFVSILFSHFYALPQFAFLIKIIFSLLFIFAISLLQIIFKFPLSTFIYGYLSTFISFINIFIFTFIDISLFIPFSLEFIILLITSNFKQKKGLFFTLFLMIVPFLPYIIFTDTIVRNNLSRLASHTSFFGNILLSMFLIPFQIIWIKILIRMKHFGKQKGVTFKRITSDIIMNFGAIIFIILFIQLLVRTNIISEENFEKTNPILEFQNSENSENSENSYIKTISNRTVNYDTEDTECIIESELHVLRYEIKIHSNSILPIYEANYPYDILTEQEWAILSLDDYPPNHLVLRFSSQASLDKELYITSYLQNEKDTIKLEKIIYFQSLDESRGIDES